MEREKRANGIFRGEIELLKEKDRTQQDEIGLLHSEKVKILDGVKMSVTEKKSDTGRFRELLADYERKLEKEMSEKHDFMNLKAREINNLHDIINELEIQNDKEKEDKRLFIKQRDTKIIELEGEVYNLKEKLNQEKDNSRIIENQVAQEKE
jgi:hypothetical protein